MIEVVEACSSEVGAVAELSEGAANHSIEAPVVAVELAAVAEMRDQAADTPPFAAACRIAVAVLASPPDGCDLARESQAY